MIENRVKRAEGITKRYGCKAGANQWVQEYCKSLRAMLQVGRGLMDRKIIHRPVY